MRRVLLPLLVLVLGSAGFGAETPRAATPEDQALLKTALKNTEQDIDRWAYTETSTTTQSRGRQKGATIVRFDPSKPYAEQYTPQLIDGKAPTKRQLEEYRQRGEKRGERVARAAANADLPPSERPAASATDGRTQPDLEHAYVVSDDASHVTYQVVLKGNGREKVPLDKLEVLVRVDKVRRVLENISAGLTEPVRVKVIAKVNHADMDVNFTAIDPQYAPVITTLHGTGDGSAFFIKVEVRTDRTRTDFQRVKPYDERFEVKVGALKALDQ